MVDIYRTIQLNRANLGAVNIGLAVQALWPNTLGGTIMQRSRGQAQYVHHGNYVYDDEVVGYLYSVLRANGWKWAPSVEGANGGAVLDFEQDAGECRYVSAALELLFYAPAPYGFQLPQGNVQTVQYNGANEAGFMAVHDPARAFGLGYNVISTTSRNLLPGYYLWANHWVTHWAGDYYDANYNRIYAALPAMAAIQMASVTPKSRDDGSYLIVVDTVDLSHTANAALDGLYVKTQGNDYARQVIDRARQQNSTTYGAELRSVPFVGPFPRPYRDDGDYTIPLS
ncbi:hypothetical protein SAMN06265365_105273 [Tistlia consotensis]|uniref:Uncharacterized protein n=1 Tax=Tistlia consotensis USBA 355 TaxID=560819 RepID=A0A1Y6BPK3_9PROT|nr:hypothetical protein [Tistlia consotensis]SMF11650.1 hypothetical protein SAMN05428998_10525 [Tistlia consotensis USBA 355]SNR51754.1 hypothetical protein SAMN06265365_105273 [Tistlia consotensis]